MGNPTKRRIPPDHLRERAIEIFNRVDWWTSKTGCIIWPKAVCTGGYGDICVRDKDRTSYHFLAHRMAWELKNGPIPEGMWMLHKCDERRCCNPDHLFLGTEQDNWNDMKAKKRHPHGERHHWATLNEGQVLEIRQLLKQGLRRSDIGRRFGVGETCVSNIKLGKTWRHLK